jgi:hypothetical protein
MKVTLVVIVALAVVLLLCKKTCKNCKSQEK